MTTTEATRRVRVLFGQHVVSQIIAEPPFAARHEAAMRRRFPSLRVTNEPVHKTGNLPFTGQQDSHKRPGHGGAGT
jgi:hypothetical protein